MSTTNERAFERDNEQWMQSQAREASKNDRMTGMVRCPNLVCVKGHVRLFVRYVGIQEFTCPTCHGTGFVAEKEGM